MANIANELYEHIKKFVQEERNLGASEKSIKLALRNMCRDSFNQ